MAKETEFETLQLEGEIAEDVIKNIENSKNYLDDYIQTIIEDNTLRIPKTRPLTLCIPKNRPLTLCIPKTRPLTLCIKKTRPFLQK
jgi:hypothetical protein